MIFPQVYQYRDFSEYLRDFFSINRGRGVPMSVEFLARRLRWSAGLIKSLMSGDRHLTLPRALQFSDFAKMDIFDTERLCKLAFPLIEPANVSDELLKQSLTLKEIRTLREDRVGGANVRDSIDSVSGCLLSESQIAALEAKLGDIQRWLNRVEGQSLENGEARLPFLIDLTSLELAIRDS